MHMFLAFPQQAALGISQATLGILNSSLESGRREEQYHHLHAQSLLTTWYLQSHHQTLRAATK